MVAPTGAGQTGDGSGVQWLWRLLCLGALPGGDGVSVAAHGAVPGAGVA